MSDSIHNPPENQFDTRPLLASEAVRGALVGLCWSLVVMVPVVFFTAVSGGGLLWVVVAMCVVCPIWSAIAAFAEVDRTRENTFTDEQRAVLQGRIQVPRIVALGLTLLAFVGIGIFLPRTGSWAFLIIPAIAAIWAGSYLVARANGHAAVRVMQRHTRDAAVRIDARALNAAKGEPRSERFRPSLERFTEPRLQPEPLDDGGLENG